MVAARLGLVVAAAAGMVGLTVVATDAVGPARAAGSSAASMPYSVATHAQTVLHRASITPVHIEAVSAPVLVTVAELRQAEHAQQASAVPAAPVASHPSSAAVSSSASSSSASSSSGRTGADLGTFLVTCYDNRGPTKSGEQAGPQSVAVDPSVIPLGTEIYIEGVGYRRADDTGGGVRGHHIDIWESSYSACAAFGRQYRDVRRAS